jgi:hypothetical protein
MMVFLLSPEQREDVLDVHNLGLDLHMSSCPSLVVVAVKIMLDHSVIDRYLNTSVARIHLREASIGKVVLLKRQVWKQDR